MEREKEVRREPQGSSIPVPAVSNWFRILFVLIMPVNIFSQWYDKLPGISDLGDASWKIPRVYEISKLENQLQD